MNKPQIIMLPGWGMEASVWGLFQDKLSKYFDLSFIEWRGVSSLTCFRERVIQQIETKIEAENKSSLILLGWSLGSLVAFEIATRYPSIINRLIILGGTSRFIKDESEQYHVGWHRRMVERMKFQLQRDKQKCLSAFYQSMFSSGEQERGDHERFLRIVKEKFCGDDTTSLLVGLDYLIQIDLRDKLKLIQAPLLLIHGEDDRICPVSAVQHISGVVKGSEIKILSGVGHVPFFTSVDECFVTIREFVEKEQRND
ncbi:alpha/beta hydrolase [Microaerobacter geothermalis]|uniref:alpha/beta fold hydrolase n=1 Tax=Microaerobacter geothermalis TaxID=674972 RepID=UPI001F1F8422|nr:alpha/beta hydrolase [Microaerobacter geothermalis]MCF6094286.1 alpha/beta hydrolase [Microaerobacter geothermalis]